SALKVNAAKIASKGIQSIRSRVANISEFLSEPMTIEQFRAHLLHSIFGGQAVPTVDLTEQDWQRIKELAEERYRNWDWNYGKSPACNVVRSHRFEGIGTIEVQLQIENGSIQDVHIFGDFFGTDDVSAIEDRLRGTPYRKEAVEQTL